LIKGLKPAQAGFVCVATVSTAGSGKRLYKVNPKHTSQTCSQCGHIDKARIHGEKFICTNCGHIDDANLQAARNVKQKAISLYGLNIIKVFKKKVRGDSPHCVAVGVASTNTNDSF
jgi:putative transposase